MAKGNYLPHWLFINHLKNKNETDLFDIAFAMPRILGICPIYTERNGEN
jgi:hypothetical protein